MLNCTSDISPAYLHRNLFWFWFISGVPHCKTACSSKRCYSFIVCCTPTNGGQSQEKSKYSHSHMHTCLPRERYVAAGRQAGTIHIPTEASFKEAGRSGMTSGSLSLSCMCVWIPSEILKGSRLPASTMGYACLCFSYRCACKGYVTCS